MSSQNLLKGDMNGDGKITLADVTALANVVVGKAPVEAINVYEVDNRGLVGTWYASNGTVLTFNADGTTNYPGGVTYEFMPILGLLQVFDAGGSIVDSKTFKTITTQYLLEEDTETSALTYYTNSAYVISDITLNRTTLSLNTGGTSQLRATVLPLDALNTGVSWSSSNPDVATVNANGLVTAVAGGTCTITCTAKDGGGVVATCLVTVVGGGSDTHEYVNLGLPSGTLWATCNIGADSPEDYGLYFAWGETTGYTQDTSDGHSFDWTSYKYAIDDKNNLTKYCGNSSYGYNGFTDTFTELEPDDDAAYVNWGSDWRMPSYAQQTELRTECTWTWTTRNGKNGYEVKGPNGNALFLPTAGIRLDTSLNHAGLRGFYWSRTLNTSSPYYAYGLYFNSYDVDWSSGYRCYGRSVRPVRASK